MKLKTKKYDWRLVLAAAFFIATGVIALVSTRAEKPDTPPGQEARLIDPPGLQRNEKSRQDVPDEENLDNVDTIEEGIE